MDKYIKIDNLYDAIEYDHDIDKWTMTEEKLDNLPTYFEWIPTSEKMPPDEKFVIGYTPASNDMFIGYHREDWYNPKGKWICLGPMGAPRTVTKKVTHWMFCPEVPEA